MIDHIKSPYSVGIVVTKMRVYKNVPVEVDEQLQNFDYNYVNDPALRQVCLITSGGKTLVINGDFTVICSDMPEEWIYPALHALKLLLNIETPADLKEESHIPKWVSILKDVYSRLSREKFKNVPVEINGRYQPFNFELLKDQDGRLWIANSKAITLYIHEDFSYDNFSMPEEWINPAIRTLKKLLRHKPEKNRLQFNLTLLMAPLSCTDMI